MYHLVPCYSYIIIVVYRLDDDRKLQHHLLTLPLRASQARHVSIRGPRCIRVIGGLQCAMAQNFFRYILCIRCVCDLLPSLGPRRCLFTSVRRLNDTMRCQREHTVGSLFTSCPRTLSLLAGRFLLNCGKFSRSGLGKPYCTVAGFAVRYVGGGG